MLTDMGKRRKYKHEYYLKHKEKYYQWCKEWQKAHPDKVKEHRKKQYQKRRIKQLRYASQWRKDNPTWTKQVRKRYRNICQTCGGIATHSHHIFHRSKYPQLQSNINNGIALCMTCHQQVHGVNLVG